MGVLKRFTDIMSANINAILDKAEDPAKMIDQYLRDLEKDLGNVKAETASVMAEEKRAKRELDECDEMIAKLSNYAEKALLSGNEADARTFLEKKGEYSNKKTTLLQAYEMAKSNAEKMQAMHDKLVKDIASLNTRRDQIKAKVAMAKAQEKINKIGSSMSNASVNLSAFDKMEAKANKMLDEASAMAELNQGKEEASVEDLMAKYDTPSSQNGQVEDELEKLKEKLGL